MKIVSLVNTLANQSLTFSEDGDFYELTVRATDNVMLMDVSRNGVALLTSHRCVDRNIVIPRYKEDGRGNMSFWNDQENYPWYEDFGVTTFLSYYSPAELASARATLEAARTAEITA